MHVPSSRTAIVVAHPGHELRVHGFLCASRPSAVLPVAGG
jgi:hypothetical protein